MKQHSPHMTMAVDCGVQECLKRLTAASCMAPCPLFAIFGHHRPDSGFTYQNARDWFVIQDPPKNLEGDVQCSQPRQLVVRIFFGAELQAQDSQQQPFFEKLNTLATPYLVVCPFVLAHETSSPEPFLALGWQTELQLYAESSEAKACTLNLMAPSAEQLSRFQSWLTGALAVESTPQFSQPQDPQTPHLSLESDAFTAAIKKVQSKMQQGHAYLINLAVQATGLKTEDAYLPESFCNNLFIDVLRYFVFFRFDAFAIMSYSPERFIKIVESAILTEPIKGTLALAPHCEVQTACAALWESEKELNEQCMVVDLLRNDLNTICQAGSVGVARPFTIHQVGGLLQMQSYIFGQLAEAVNLGDVLQNLLPAGSISGTPKIECCRIISALEPVPRGFFTGIFGICEQRNNALHFDSCILIRSHFLGHLGSYAGAGCGITTLSDPAAEFNEVKQKINSFSGHLL